MEHLYRVTWTEIHSVDVWADNPTEAEEFAQQEDDTLKDITSIETEVLESKEKYDGPDTIEEAEGMR